MARNTGHSNTGHSNTGHVGPISTGTGGAKGQFFKALAESMENEGWKTLTITGFDWAALETGHHDIDTLFAAFDADFNRSILEGAHAKLSRWADGHKSMPETRIAIAVFDQATRDQIEYITTKLQAGTRMGVQSLTAVIDLKTKQTFEPQEGSGAGYERIRINKVVFEQLRKVVKVLAAGYSQ